MRLKFNTPLQYALLLISILLLSLYIKDNHFTDNALTQIEKRGELNIVTRNSATTYYYRDEEPTGFEYDLAKAFANELGVSASFTTLEHFDSILPGLESGHVDLAAAGTTITTERKNLVNFSVPYNEISQLLLYRAGESKPTTIEDLRDATIDVLDNSSHHDQLIQLKERYPFLNWRSHSTLDIEQLFNKLNYGEIDYLICDSIDFNLNKRFFPQLRKGFTISTAESLAWVFPKGKDDSLINKANEFLEKSKDNGFLEELHEKHFDHADGLDYAGSVTFFHHTKNRLSKLIPIFKQAAEKHKLDWRLIAAISYQESHWNPKAVSPTGVRGLMMLTQNTAKQLGIKNRRDPVQSTEGGARYFVRMKGKLPDRIAEPDRSWLALAAYNIGYGHLEDARVITERKGGNPDRWADIRDSLPLLEKKKWYKKTRYGYARGREAALYVRNIRNYYDLLNWKFKTEPPQD